ncbi:MAG TPA: PQQ-binding-like beta-propeller repeat protein, partial [Gemmataceae bacterium]|nr:PQQ-binding-like beta-propeller repeat protein [Gemmataceae bacterium]
DPEVARRAQDCLRRLEKVEAPEVLAAAARLLGRRAPAGAVRALLDYLPFAEGGVADEVCQALAAAGARGGKADPALVGALEDKLAVRRAAAGEALVRAGPDHRAAVRKLLRDPEAAVRQRVGLALVEAREKQALPVLIALLTELPGEEAVRVEETLLAVAGDKAPPAALSPDPAARRKARTAWEAWWKERGDKIDLAAVELSRRLLGYTLVVEFERVVRDGRVAEYDRDGHKRWEITGLSSPMSAQALPGGRVLITEYGARAVTERNTKGEVLWRYDARAAVVSARRLPNGNTLVVTRTRVYEVDRARREVATLAPAVPGPIAGACKLRGGHTGIVTTAGEFFRFDASGKKVKSFAVGGTALPISSGVQPLPNDHILVALYTQNKVAEFDADGREVWHATMRRPSSAYRLPNGHTLVASRMSQVVTELDRKGQPVATLPVGGRVFSASRR